jgi:hypothetical protein
VCSILEYEAACWDPYRDGQVIASDPVQKKAVKFGSHTSDSVWENLAQRSKIGRICALLKAYPGEMAWKGTGDRLQGTCYLSRAGQFGKLVVGHKGQILGSIFFCK